MAKRKAEGSPSDPPSFEDSLASLEAIVHDLEEGELGLAESMARYEQGIKHLRQCHELLEQAERKIELLTGIDAEGNPQVVPFGGEQASLESQAGTRRRGKPSSSRPLLNVEDEGEEDDD